MGNKRHQKAGEQDFLDALRHATLFETVQCTETARFILVPAEDMYVIHGVLQDAGKLLRFETVPSGPHSYGGYLKHITKLANLFARARHAAGYKNSSAASVITVFAQLHQASLSCSRLLYGYHSVWYSTSERALVVERAALTPPQHSNGVCYDQLSLFTDVSLSDEPQRQEQDEEVSAWMSQ